MTRVLIADDHPLMLSGIETVLRGTEYEVVAKVRDGAAALDAMAETQPDILILDVKMPELSGMDVLRTLRGRGDKRPVVFVTAIISDEALVEALDLGVNGIIPKDGAETMLVDCLGQVRVGGRWIEGALQQRAIDFVSNPHTGPRDPLARLSPRERSIAALVAQGLRNKEIGNDLGMTEGSIKVYLHRMYEKLGIQTRTELAMLSRPAADRSKG